MDNADIHNPSEIKTITHHRQPPSTEEVGPITCPSFKNGEELQYLAKTEIHREKRRILKNIIILAFAFFLNFTAYDGLSNLQSSLHREEGIGLMTQSALNAALLFSSLFAPSLIVSKIGYKWTIATGIVGYGMWTAANGYAVWGTMLTASIIVGLCAGPLWVAQGSYYSKMGARYARLTGQPRDVVISRFFGAFFFTNRVAHTIGYVISSTVLMKKPQNSSAVTAEALASCGAYDCPWDNSTNSNLEKPPPDLVWTLVAVYATCQLLGLLTVIFLIDGKIENKTTNDPRNSQSLLEKSATNAPAEGAPAESQQTWLRLVLAPLRQLRKKEHLLMLPLVLYEGFAGGLINGEFTRSFVSCTLGIWIVGFVMTSSGLSGLLASVVLSAVVKKTGRIPLFYTVFLGEIGILLAMLLWKPHPSQTVAFFLLAMSWGFADMVFSTQMSAFYGAVFTEESDAAFSTYSFLCSFGASISYGIGYYICTYVKIGISLSLLILGICGYSLAEFVL